MDILLKNEFLHHAYIIEGDKDNIIPELVSFLEKTHGIVVRGNPDFWHRDFETFGIGEAHALKDAQARRGLAGNKKIFIFSVRIITEEAQNALLKIFEEPTEGTHFFVIIPTLARIIPTLFSRATVVPSIAPHKSYDISYEKRAEHFLRASSLNRLSAIAEMIEEKNKTEALLLLNAIEKKLADNFYQSNMSEGVAAAQLKKTANARKNLMAKSSSIKLIFEHLALTL